MSGEYTEAELAALAKKNAAFLRSLTAPVKRVVRPEDVLPGDRHPHGVPIPKQGAKR